MAIPVVEFGKNLLRHSDGNNDLSTQKNYQVIPKSLRSVVDGSGPQTVSFYRPIWPSCLREAAWPRLEDGLHRAKVIFLESSTENLMATFWAIHILCQHILDLFGPYPLCQPKCSTERQQKGSKPTHPIDMLT